MAAQVQSSTLVQRCELGESVWVEILPAWQDNYIYLLVDEDSGEVAVVDPTDAQVVIRRLEDLGLSAHKILCTHHHKDHVAGNLELKAKFEAEVHCSEYDLARVPGADHGLKAGDQLTFGRYQVEILETPGHTLGAICFWLPELSCLFTGDTLFSLGCGRLFEGSAEQMHMSLSRLAKLPSDTKIFCGHEYTESNCRFSLTVDPENKDLKRKLGMILERREQNRPTLPANLAEELATNPFLRPGELSIQEHLSMAGAEPSLVFRKVRELKDSY